MKKLLYAGFALVVMLGAVGCSDFDTNTYKTLYVSQQLLIAARTDYNTGKIPHTPCVASLIEKGNAAQHTAVLAFEAYFPVEHGIETGDPTATEAAVVDDIAAIAPIIASIKALATNPNCGA